MVSLVKAGSKFGGSLFSRKFTLWFGKKITQGQPMNPNEIAEAINDLKDELKDNENFRIQAGKVGVSKHHAELNLYRAFKSVEHNIKPILALPEKEANADKGWADLAVQFKIIEDNAAAFFLSISAFVTAFQLETKNLNVEKGALQKLESEVNRNPEELRFMEKILSINGIFDQLQAKLKIVIEEAKKYDQAGLAHLPAEAQEKILDARPLIPFSVKFREICEEERKAIKYVKRFFKQYHHRIYNYEAKAEVLAQNMKLNRKATVAYAGDFIVSLTTLGNALTALTLFGLVFSPVGPLGFFGIAAGGWISSITALGASQAIGWTKVLYKPVTELYTSFGVSKIHPAALLKATYRMIRK